MSIIFLKKFNFFFFEKIKTYIYGGVEDGIRLMRWIERLEKGL